MMQTACVSCRVMRMRIVAKTMIVMGKTYREVGEYLRRNNLDANVHIYIGIMLDRVSVIFPDGSEKTIIERNKL